jgi:hypothetical protein
MGDWQIINGKFKRIFNSKEQNITPLSRTIKSQQTDRNKNIAQSNIECCDS